MAASPPPITVTAQAGMARQAAQVREFDPHLLANSMRLVGLRNAGGPIRLVVAGEDSAAARAAPPWITGYAYGAMGEAVLFAERVPKYPAGSMDELIVHEVTHILIDRAAAHRPVPRWFHEGLALTAARPWNLGDRTRVSLALLFGPKATLSEVETAFGGDRKDVERAYAVSGAFVLHLLEEGGPDTAARILRGVAAGREFAAAFRSATGVPMEVVEAQFWARASLLYRWLPILTSSFTLWLGITGLAFVAFWRRKQRDRALQERWELEDLAAAADDDQVH